MEKFKAHNRLSQTLTYAPGGATDAMKPMDAIRYSTGARLPRLDMSLLKQLEDPFHRYDLSSRTVTHDERQALQESARNTYRPANAPAWLKHDRQVLRFSAYFQEPVAENPRENFRVRHCVVMYHLEDGTMSVQEPKTENSGLRQGNMVRRHRMSRPDSEGGGFYTHEDLFVGANINIYSHVYRLTDCDAFTRDYYGRALGRSQPEAEEPPLDSFRASQVGTSIAPRSSRSQGVAEAQEYNEIYAGGSRKNQKLEQYLLNDRKVLKFKCFWDDPTRYGARMYYTLHYYLADDSVEILENLARNSGRDPYPVFWRRAPLRKNPHVAPAPGMIEPAAILYKPEDFMVGYFIDVHRRHLYLYDCDEFTRDFYRSHLGLEQDGQEIKHPPPVHTKLAPPPHVGFGAPEDSLASCLHLTPRPPRRNINKLMRDSDKILRFEARMSSGSKDETHRRFVVAAYPADDHVAVWEQRQRNSGHAEGKFALKSRKHNSATGTWFTCSDFRVGEVVEINTTPFFLSNADEATWQFMEEYCHEFPASDAVLVASKLGKLREDLQRGGMIPLDQLRQLAEEKLGICLSTHELVTLSRAFGEPGLSVDAKLLANQERLN